MCFFLPHGIRYLIRMIPFQGNPRRRGTASGICPRSTISCSASSIDLSALRKLVPGCADVCADDLQPGRDAHHGVEVSKGNVFNDCPWR